MEDGWKGEVREDKEAPTPEEEEDTRQSHEEHMRQIAGMAIINLSVYKRSHEKRPINLFTRIS